MPVHKSNVMIILSLVHCYMLFTSLNELELNVVILNCMVFVISSYSVIIIFYTIINFLP